MSNGSAPIGAVDIKQDEGTYTFGVGEAWSSSDNWTMLQVDLNDQRLATIDMDYDQARELAALLLRSAGNTDLAEAIPADMAKREAKPGQFV